MNNCPFELLSHIFEYACCDDFGETARCLGLVSKQFRAIVEPIELRTIKVSGIEQLRSAFARLENSYQRTADFSSNGMLFYVEHLFISELTANHALVVDSPIARSQHCSSSHSHSSFWRTEEGLIAGEFYHLHAVEFWNKASAFIKCASSTLRTLCLISSNNLFRGRYYGETPSPKILGVLNGAVLPNLTFLTVNHDAVFENTWFDDSNCSFRFPSVPSLRRLHIISPVSLDEPRRDQVPHQYLHPLLADLLSESQEIQHLTICDGEIRSVEKLLKEIFGEQWEESMENRTLPRKLQTVVLQQGIMPYFFCGTGRMQHLRWSRDFVKTVQRLGIDGVEAHLPTPMYPGPGEREFELLLAEWKEQRIIQFR